MPEETYKTSLRAYISSLVGKGDAKKTIDKARQVMDALKKPTDPNPQGQQTRLVSIMSASRKTSATNGDCRTSGKEVAGRGFETFFKEVAADATELNAMNWVGDTYLGMGEAFGTKLANAHAEAKGYFVKAAETYQKILDSGKTGADSSRRRWPRHTDQAGKDEKVHRRLRRFLRYSGSDSQGEPDGAAGSDQAAAPVSRWRDRNGQERHDTIGAVVVVRGLTRARTTKTRFGAGARLPG